MTQSRPPAAAEASRRPAVSIIVPVFNEADNVQVLHKRLTETLTAYGRTYEILFIDDGSTDGSVDALKKLHARDAAVRVIRFVRNFGQQLATSAGLQYARGDTIVLIDADLQSAPEDIPQMVDKLGEGYDLVYGIRRRRVGSPIRRLGSWAMTHVVYRAAGIDIPHGASGFVALDRHFVDDINLFNEKTKYLSGLFAWLSYGRWATVPITFSERHAGTSKYSTLTLIRLTLTFVCSFTIFPLRIALYLGGLVALLSLAGLGWLFLRELLGWDTAAHATWSIIGAMGLLTGVQLVAMGIIGQYLSRIYREVRQQPSFVVREVLDNAPPDA